MSLLEIKKSDVLEIITTATNGDYDDVDGSQKIKILNDSNNNNHHITNSTSDQPQIILQTDEFITVVVNEKSGSKSTREFIEDDELSDVEKQKTATSSESVQKDINEDIYSADKNFPKSILTNNSDTIDRKSLLRKKSVSFETNEDVKKFIAGEEIIDKLNPFRSNIIIDGDNNSGDKYRIIKGKKQSSIPTTVKPAPLASEENDFITKEEILKQSKCVPVYIRHPDKVLTYPKPVLAKLTPSGADSISNGNLNNSRKIPVPLPRKASAKLSTTSKSDKKEKKRSRVRNPNYPDLSDIKVKTGTDIDESLYDPNEVVLNAKKFDSRFKKFQFGSTDDLEEIGDREEETSITANQAKSPSGEEPTIKVEEKKSYTNTVNSEEFRQYLKKKGLLLFPIKANGESTTSNGSAKNNISRQIDEADMSDMDERNGKKKSVFSRLSSIFTSSKGKTMPKSSEPLSRLSYAHAKPDNNGNLSSNIKRVILERNASDNRSVSANSEFMQHFSSLDRQRNSDERSDDNKSSISSVLTAAADDDDEDVNTPVIVRRKNMQNGGGNLLYRNIDLNKSKLYQSKVRQYNGEQPQVYVMNNGKGVKGSEDIIKPKVQRPQANDSIASSSSSSQLLPRQNSNTKSLIKPPIPLRRSTERQSMPVMRSGERYRPIAAERITKVENTSIPRTPNGTADKIKLNTSTPSGDDKRGTRASLTSPTLSPIKQQQQQRPSEIDPITFAKIHEIKKKTDEVLLNKSSQLYSNRPTTSSVSDMKLQNNLRLNGQNFARNSPQRSTITEVYQNRLAETPNMKQRDDYGYANNLLVNGRQSATLNRSHLQQPPRSQSVLDNMTMYKDSIYGEVTYRGPDGSNVNVMMRRPESSTMDRNQVMQKIYEYYRKSVNNTPVPFQEQQSQQRNNLQYKSQSTDTSPVSYASVNTMRSTNKNNPNGVATAAVDNRRRNYFYTSSRPSTMSSTKSDASRNHTISETDSVFLPENEGVVGNGRGSIMANDTHFAVVNSEKLRPLDVLRMQQQQQKAQRMAMYAEPDRIYDVVYGSGAYGNINRSQPTKLVQRPASAMGGSLLLPQQTSNRHAMGRMTPLILQQPTPPTTTQLMARQGDIIINNQIYRPISTIPTQAMSPPKQSQLPQQQTPQPIYSTPTRRKTATSYESDSEAGEIQSIMGRKYGEFILCDKKYF